MEREQMEYEQVEEIDLRHYFEVILKWKWIIILFTVACIVTSYLVSTFVLTPIYETKAVLMVTQQNARKISQENSLESTVDNFSPMLQLNLNVFTGQFKSTEILNSVLKKLNLEKQGYSVQELASCITVTGDEKTSMIDVKVDNTDPALAAGIANTLVDEFYVYLFNSNQKQMESAVAYLTTQLQETEKELEESKKNYQDETEVRSSELLATELTSKTQILNNTRSELMLAKLELEQLMAGKKILENNLASTPAKILVKKTYLDDFPLTEPDPSEMENQAKYVISEEANPLYLELVKTLDIRDAEIAQTNVKIVGMGKNIEILEQEIVQLQVDITKKQAEESTLERKLESLENAYTVLKGKIIETQIAKSADFGRMNITLISPAYHPGSPVKPNKTLNLAIAAVLGIMGGILLAFGLDFFDDTVKTAEDLKKIIDGPVLATIPVGRKRN